MSAVISGSRYTDKPVNILDLDELELRQIIRRLGEIPEVVRQVSFTQIIRRIFCASSFAMAISQKKLHGSDEDWEYRLQRRSASLSPYVGKHLICVFIRLPGVHYTIEVDPGERRVVHWEWQAT